MTFHDAVPSVPRDHDVGHVISGKAFLGGLTHVVNPNHHKKWYKMVKTILKRLLLIGLPTYLDPFEHRERPDLASQDSLRPISL